jgi:two-component system, OmpR family, response regulator
MGEGKLSILYVDDDKDIREIVGLSLALDSDIELRSYASGEDALDMLDAGEWRPGLILLDVMMPKIDGRRLMEMLRTISGLNDVPFVFITARAREADIADYKAQGAADVVVKPFDPLGLPDRLRAIAAAHAL